MSKEFEKMSLFRPKASTVSRDKVRIVVMGAGGVGKTSIVQQFVNNKFTQQYRKTLVEVHQVDDDFINIDIVDTGEIKEPALRYISIVMGHAFILVYAIDDTESFDKVSSLREEIIRLKGDDVPIMVVGNKSDIPERRVNAVVADCVASIDWECSHQEISAKDNVGVSGLFWELFFHPILRTKLKTFKGNKMRNASLPHGIGFK